MFTDMYAEMMVVSMPGRINISEWVVFNIGIAIKCLRIMHAGHDAVGLYEPAQPSIIITRIVKVEVGLGVVLLAGEFIIGVHSRLPIKIAERIIEEFSRIGAVLIADQRGALLVIDMIIVNVSGRGDRLTGNARRTCKDVFGSIRPDPGRGIVAGRHTLKELPDIDRRRTPTNLLDPAAIAVIDEAGGARRRGIGDQPKIGRASC